MYTKTALGFAAAVALTLAAGAFQPASANYAACVENPQAAGCPMAPKQFHESSAKPALTKHAGRGMRRGEVQRDLVFARDELTAVPRSSITFPKMVASNRR